MSRRDAFSPSFDAAMCDPRRRPADPNRDGGTSNGATEWARTTVHRAAKPRAVDASAAALTRLSAAFSAFGRNDTAAAHALLREAIRMDRSVLDDGAKTVRTVLIEHGRDHAAEQHEAALRRVFAHLPEELAWLTPYCDLTVALSYLGRGVDAIMTGQIEDGSRELRRAADLGARLDRRWCAALVEQLAGHEAEHGAAATRALVLELSRRLRIVGTRSTVRWFQGHYFVHRALRHYRQGQYDLVMGDVARAVLARPLYLTNRGVLAMVYRVGISVLVGRRRHREGGHGDHGR